MNHMHDKLSRAFDSILRTLVAQCHCLIMQGHTFSYLLLMANSWSVLIRDHKYSKNDLV